MTNTSGWSMCQIICWLTAVVAGLIVLCLASAPLSFFAALLIGAALALLLGLVLTRLVCSSTAQSAAAGDSSAAARDAGPAKAAGEATTAAAKDTVAVAKAAGTAAKETAKAAGEKTKDTAASAAKKAKAAGSEVADKAKSAKSAAKKAGSKATGAAKKAGAKTKDATTTAAAAVKDAAGIPDYDKDGTLEGTSEGARPEALSAPRGGKADNLKEIKGIGPKLEVMCNEMGFYHFDQIAAWGAQEVAWVDANLKGFRGRVSRDKWVEQAKILAAGGETEFSKRVEDGGVY